MPSGAVITGAAPKRDVEHFTLCPACGCANDATAAVPNFARLLVLSPNLRPVPAALAGAFSLRVIPILQMAPAFPYKQGAIKLGETALISQPLFHAGWII